MKNVLILTRDKWRQCGTDENVGRGKDEVEKAKPVFTTVKTVTWQTSPFTEPVHSVNNRFFFSLFYCKMPGWEESRGGVREERAGSVRAAPSTDHYTAEHAVEHTGIQEVPWTKAESSPPPNMVKEVETKVSYIFLILFFSWAVLWFSATWQSTESW